MSITSTETLLDLEPVGSVDTAAKIFLLGDDPNASTDKLDPSDPANTFILNSNDFVNLQKYVRACTSLPSSESLFESEYSRENLKKFFDQDETLYDHMKEVLPRMHKRASDFQKDTIEPMITLGGRIGNFAKDSGNYIGTIVSSLMVMGEPGMVKGNLKYDSAKRTADRMLDRLTEHAGEVEQQCQEMFVKLTDYKVDTETKDLKDILDIDKRLKKIIPDEEAKRSKVRKLVDDAKLLVDQAREMLEAETEKAREAGKLKWYRKCIALGTGVDNYNVADLWVTKDYIPVVGTIMLIIDIVKHKGLLNSLKELNDKFVLAKQKGENAIESITAASHQLDCLTNEIKGVTETINNALLSVEKMQKTFGSLQTMFQDIKKKLGYVNSDINSEFMDSYVVPLDDLKDAAQTWKRVYILAKVFQSTGLVLDGKDAPGQEQGEKAG